MARRGGTGGSHFGGSTSPRGASGRGSSSSRMGHSGPRGRTGVYIGIGGHYHRPHHGPHYGGAPTPGWAICIVLAIFIAFFSIPFFIMSSSCNYSIKIIEDDFFYYQNIVSYAKQNPENIVEATITGVYMNTEADKWYIEYNLIEDDSLFSREGLYIRTTYSMYSDEEIVKYRAGNKISVAVDRMPITVNTDSMSMDFLNYTIEDDGEYQQLIKQRMTYKIIASAILIGSGVLVVLGIVFAVKSSKQTEEDKESDTQLNSEASNSKKANYCPYCGCKAEEGRKKCEHCGANIRWKKE